MSCTSPGCYLVPFEGGKPRRLMEDHPTGLHPLGRVVYLPCGGCLSCRRERRQELTLLQMAEASLYEDNWFLTLTYDDEKYFSDQGIYPYSLVKSHLSHFNESMRKYLLYHGKIYRFFACGEYGDRYERPHYHLSLFNITPEDLNIADNEEVRKQRIKNINFSSLSRVHEDTFDEKGNSYFFSSVIADRWPYGSHKLYRANRQTFQYVASYCTKKLSGQSAKDFQLTGRVLPFFAQSRPSIGRPFFDKYYNDISKVSFDKLVNDSLSVGDVEWKIPRIFSRWLEAMDQFDGKVVSDRLKFLRTLESPLVPDRVDLKRKADYDKFTAKRYQEQNLSHKEIK